MYVTTTLLAVMLVMLASAPAAFAQSGPGGVDKEGEWHVGEGLEHGDYFYYALCHATYKDCRNFEFEFWIKGDVAVRSETELLVEVLVRDGDRVATGNMTLGKITLEPTGSSPELNDYRRAFGLSVTGLSASAPADAPKAFSDTSWGKISPIGGEQILPTAIEDITVPAGVWENTVVVSWSVGGVYSRVWVADGFPFPIKAETFLSLPTFPRPIEYEFELQNYGNFQESPFEGIISSEYEQRVKGCEIDIERTAQVVKTSDKYNVDVWYGPEYPAEGCVMEWFVAFSNENNMGLSDVQFDVQVLDGSGTVTRSIAAEAGERFLYAPSGLYLFDTIVKEPAGVSEYVVVIYGTAPESERPHPDGLGTISIPITVAPGLVASNAVPEWVRATAGYWANGSIDDATFAGAMGFLMENGVIQAPPAESAGAPEPGPAPRWVKAVAGKWAGGGADDHAFVGVLQFLVRNGTIDPA